MTSSVAMPPQPNWYHQQQNGVGQVEPAPTYEQTLQAARERLVQRRVRITQTQPYQSSQNAHLQQPQQLGHQQAPSFDNNRPLMNAYQDSRVSMQPRQVEEEMSSPQKQFASSTPQLYDHTGQRPPSTSSAPVPPLLPKQPNQRQSNNEPVFAAHPSANRVVSRQIEEQSRLDAIAQGRLSDSGSVYQGTARSGDFLQMDIDTSYGRTQSKPEVKYQTLMDAIKSEDEASTQQLIYKQIDDINGQDENGDTALILAMRYDSQDVVQRLVLKGADVNFVNFYGNSCLAEAARVGNFKMVQFLVGHGANVAYEDGLAMRVASQSGHSRIFEFLQSVMAALHDD